MRICKEIDVNSVILIVEDQATDALVLRAAVGGLGDVHMAIDGFTALALARQHKPDLVLLDIEMNGMNGFSVCKALKADPELCDAAVIFVTSHVQTDNELLALEYGGIVFIRKPLNLPVARAHIKAHLALRREAKKLANHDALTGLPNRTLLKDRTDQALHKARRSNVRVAMLLLDVDNFKSINDFGGHSIGDALLKEVAVRLEQAANALDTVSRQGGNEFIILSPEVGAFEGLGELAERLLAVIAMPFVLQGNRYEISASLGISVFPDDSDDVESLYRHAGSAMYQAKLDGRNRFRFFSPDIESGARGRHILEQNMRSALEDGFFEVYYQPKVRANGALMVGIEALIRWRNSSGELVSPTEFIPLAELNGLIIPIGKYVLRRACLDAQMLIERGMPVVVSVNISAVQFVEESFLSMVEETLRESKLQPEFLELEITEGVLAKNVQNTQHVLAVLRKQGIRIAIDDFGTGYSSLAYLKRFPVDVLKIDQSFVRDMLFNKSDRVIIEAIIKLAQALNLEIVAEGVETQEQADLLQQNGCEIMQGYLYAHPVPFSQLCALLDSGAMKIKQ